MASRYLRASGNWNGPVWAATSDGVAGSVSTPSSDDYVILLSSFTVNLVSDVTIRQLNIAVGRLNANGYKIDAYAGVRANGGTLDISNSRIRVDVQYGFGLDFSGSGTLIATNSLIEADVKGEFSSTPEFQGASKTFGDVRLNLGVGSSAALSISLTGSPTFRSLIIQSKNVAAHTVTLDSNLTVDKFVAVGSSATNRLTIKNGQSPLTSRIDIQLPDTGSVYGQNVNIPDQDFASVVSARRSTGDVYYPQAYIGASSIGNDTWIYQDPPKIDTFIDTFDTATVDTTKWTVTKGGSGSVTQSGGNLNAGWGGVADSFFSIVSKDTFDLATSPLVFELVWSQITTSCSITPDIYLEITSTGLGLYNRGSLVASASLTNGYVRLQYESTQLKLATSASGTSWTTASGGAPVDSNQLRSVRVQFAGTRNMADGYLTLGSINPPLGPQVPVASFTASTTTGRAPLTVNFTDTSSGIPDSWLWNFGDGTTSTAQNPTKTYSTHGTYNVSLTATNSLGTNTVVKNAYITAQQTVITASSIDSSVDFGTGYVVTPGAVTVSPGSVESSEAFGPDFIVNMRVADYGGIDSSEAFGGYTVITGNKTVLDYGDIGSSVSFGSDWTVVRHGVIITVGSAHDGPIFGGYTVLPGPVSAAGYGDIASTTEVSTDFALIQSPPPPPPPTDWSVIGKEDKKVFVYHVYKSDGTFVGVWTDVQDDPEFTQQINTPGTTMTVQLGRSANNTKEVRAVRITEDGHERITVSGNKRINLSETSNTVGDGTDVDLNYNVDVYAHYGEFRTRITNRNRVRVTEDGHVRVTAAGAPMGVRIFSGFILDYDSVYGDEAGVTVTLASHGWELSHQVIKDGSKTTVTYPSQPIETTIKTVLDNSPGMMSYTSESIDATGVSIPATFQLNTKLEGIDHMVEQTATNWYWFGHVGENAVYVKPTKTTPDHIFVKGKHIKSLRLKRSMESLINDVYFIGGEMVDGDPSSTLYRRYTRPTSISTWRTGLHRKTDRRYKLAASAQRYADKLLDENESPSFTTPLTISSARYNTETIKLGQTVAFRNFGNFIDEVMLQIVSISYAPTAVTVELGTLLERQVDTLSKVEASLDNEQYEKIPDTPS